jgi:TetR/AcrR family transcriptional regulator
MGTSERREREKEQRRAAIISAAEELFFTKGIANTTMDEIAEKVELSKGAIYLYFKSKEELFAAIAQRGLSIILGMFKKALIRGDNGLERLRAIGDEFYRFHLEYPSYFSAIFYHEFHATIQYKDDTSSQEIFAQAEELMEMTTRVIQEGINDGSIRSDLNPQMSAIILDGLLTGIIRMVSAEKEHMMKCHCINSKDLVKTAMEMIFYSLQGPAAKDK